MSKNIEWRPVPGFPAYEVSNTGQVRRVISFGIKHPPRGSPLKPRALRRGHCYVNLYKGEGKATSVYVHRIVAEAFIGPPPTPNHQVAHWDGNAGNNHVSNLRWATNKENSQDSIRLGRSKRPRGEFAGKSKLTNEQAEMVRCDLSIGCRGFVRILGVSHGVISNIRNGKSYN